jgi:hypothetical protein
MSKAQAARTFSVSLSSVKRYVNKAERGESLVAKKRPGSPPKLVTPEKPHRAGPMGLLRRSHNTCPRYHLVSYVQEIDRRLFLT